MNKLSIRNSFLAVFFTGATMDIFFFAKTSDVRSAVLLFIWWVISYVFSLSSKVAFMSALGMLSVLFVLYFFAAEPSTMERLTTWIYLLFVYGTIQLFLEVKKELEH